MFETQTPEWGDGEPAERMCSHCGLPVPAARFTSSLEQFCCSGCETVYGLLRGAGLTEYYAFRDRLGEKGNRVDTESFEPEVEFDSEEFRRLYIKDHPSGDVSCELLLEGVHCAACVWLIERLPRLLPAVSFARLDMARSVVHLQFDQARVPLSRVAETLAKMGYRPRAFRGGEGARAQKRELRGLMIRMGVAGAVAGNVMLMAFALYSGDRGFFEEKTMDAATVRFFQWASLVVSLPSLFAGGLFFRGAWASLRTRTPHMDLPIAIGIAVAYVWGAFATISGRGEIYFDSITVLVFFLLVGRYLSRRHQFSFAGAAELLSSLVPSFAVLVTEEGERRIETSRVPAGVQVAVESGQVLSVDGRVHSGTSSLDKSLLSGESLPVLVQPGDLVEAGSLNLGSRLIVTVRETGRDTRVGKFLREVEQATSARTPLIAQADRISGWFTLIVLTLALLVFLLWLPHSRFMAVEHALTLLIVACPCALGMATPLSVSAAVSQAAATRKLVFSPDAFEKMARPMDIVFDKTGTLTEGRLLVRAWVPADEPLSKETSASELSCEKFSAESPSDREIETLVLAAERGAHHPVARALSEYLLARGVRPASTLLSVREELGSGLWAQVRADQTEAGELFVGSPRAIADRGPLPEGLKNALAQAPAPVTPVVVAFGGRVRALVLLEDKICEESSAALLRLKDLGHRLHLLSGDHPETVQAVAEQLGARTGLFVDLFSSVRGGVSPEQKLAVLSELQSGSEMQSDTAGGARRLVAMVGDGVNDAGALRGADVGISVRGAAEASRLSSDVYLAAPEVTEVAELFEGSRRCLQVVRRGMVFSLLYNAVGIACAGLGLIGPLFAAILMPLSSLTVVTNAYRSRTFRKTESKGALTS